MSPCQCHTNTHCVPIHSFHSVKDSIFVWEGGGGGSGICYIFRTTSRLQIIVCLVRQVAPHRGVFSFAPKYWLLTDKHAFIMLNKNVNNFKLNYQSQGGKTKRKFYRQQTVDQKLAFKILSK